MRRGKQKRVGAGLRRWIPAARHENAFQGNVRGMGIVVQAAADPRWVIDRVQLQIHIDRNFVTRIAGAGPSICQ